MASSPESNGSHTGAPELNASYILSSQSIDKSDTGLELKQRLPTRTTSKVHLNIDSPESLHCNGLFQSCSTTSEDSGVQESLAAISLQDLSKFKDDNKEDEQGKENNNHDAIEQFCSILAYWYQVYYVWFMVAFFLGYNVFFGFAVHRSWHRTTSYCSGVKLLTILTILAYIIVLYQYILKPYLLNGLAKKWQTDNSWLKVSSQRLLAFKIVAWVVVWGSIVGFIVFNAWHEKERLYSGAGYLGFILLGFVFSKHRNAIKWNQILWGLTMQITFGIIVLRTNVGKMVFSCIGEKINTFLAFTNSGTEMVFGYLSTGLLKGPTGNVTLVLGNNETTLGQLDLTMPIQTTIFAFNSMPVVIFFSFFVSILYFYGIMQTVVKKLGWLLQATIGTTACESISASGNIFLGMTESPLLVRPFLPIMTKSELHAVLTGGFATIAGSVMAAYISFGISASHLLSASVMAAPSALALSKLLYPEVEVTKTSAEDIQLDRGTERNAIEAGSNGAHTAIKLVANIMANLIAFMAFLAFVDSMIGWVGDMIDIPQLSFKLIMSKLLFPVALMLGIEFDDCSEIAQLIGLKMIINEFVAYQELSKLIAAASISKRSETIATYALCSFANVSSIGIQVGGLSAMAPSRRSDLAQLAVRAMIAGTMASFMTACVAGMLS